MSLPAQNTRSAAELLYLNDIVLEVVVIEASLPDVAPFVTRLRRTFSGIKAIATMAEDAVYDVSAYDGHRTKPRRRDAAAATAWVGFIQGISPPPARRSRGAT